MNDPAKVYTVWSGAPSQRIALLLREWMPIFLEGTVDCQVSPIDVKKGRRWSTELAEQLDATDVGIICLAPDNLDEAWIHFEAGALAKSVEYGHIFCFCFGVQHADLPEPLRQFQAIVFKKHDFLRFFKLINGVYGSPLSEKDIGDTFDSVWNAFSAEIQAVLDSVLDPDVDPEPDPTANVDLPIDQLRILLWFIENPSGKPTAPQLARDLNIHPAATQFHLNELFEIEYIGNDTTIDDGDAKWCLYQDGREYLQLSGLLK